MKVIDKDMFHILHPINWNVEEKHIGKAKNKIVIIKNFFRNPEKLKIYVKSVDYVSTINGEYSNLPGYIHYLGIYRKLLYEPFNYIIKNYFESSNDCFKIPEESRFNFQSYDLNEQCRLQSLYPHTDNTRYAAVLSFNNDEDYDGDDNGTAFYRSLETGEEYICMDKNYRSTRLLNTNQTKVNFDPSKAKFKEWEKYHIEPHEFNKLIVYEGNLWHSPYFTQENWYSNRLTFNAFLK